MPSVLEEPLAAPDFLRAMPELEEPPETPPATAPPVAAAPEEDWSDVALDEAGLLAPPPEPPPAVSAPARFEPKAAPGKEFEETVALPPPTFVAPPPPPPFVPAAPPPDAVAAPSPPLAKSTPEAPPAAPGAEGGEAQLRLALSQASREVIEKVVWEVVPQLAEVIIREHVDRLVSERRNR